MQESKSCALPLGDGPSSYTDKTLNIFPIFFHLIKNPCHKQGYKRWIEGFEPSASRATIWRANQLRHIHHLLGVPGGTRTPNLLLRRQLLYPAELRTHMDHLNDSLKAGDGNRTHISSLEGWCSTTELHPHDIKSNNCDLQLLNDIKFCFGCQVI